MTSVTYTCRRGADFILGFRDKNDNLTGDETVRASLKPIGPNKSVPDDDVDSAADFTASFVEPDGELPYWRLALTALQTASLTRGRYLFDVRIELAGGDVLRTDPVIVDVENRVTA